MKALRRTAQLLGLLRQTAEADTIGTVTPLTGRIHVTATEPSDPIPGDLWIDVADLEDLSLKIYLESWGTIASAALSASFGDDTALVFGTDEDAKFLWSVADSSFQVQLFSGPLKIVKDDFAEAIATFARDGACVLFFDGTSKLSTNLYGITVAGRVLVQSGDPYSPLNISHTYNVTNPPALIVGTTYPAAANTFNLMLLYANNGADLKWRVRGDGATFADGAYTGTGAGIGDYFEWADGNPWLEDRVGLTVVLEAEGKIRPALVGEEPFGVVSAIATVVGNAAEERWHGKYSSDALGRQVQEPVRDDGGAIVGYRARLDAAFDPAMFYIPRSERPEWAIVEFTGRVRVRASCPVGSRWLFLRCLATGADGSPEVNEYLAR